MLPMHDDDDDDDDDESLCLYYTTFNTRSNNQLAHRSVCFEACFFFEFIFFSNSVIDDNIIYLFVYFFI